MISKEKVSLEYLYYNKWKGCSNGMSFIKGKWEFVSDNVLIKREDTTKGGFFRCLNTQEIYFYGKIPSTEIFELLLNLIK